MSFPNEFESWLDRAIQSDIPASVRAFSFNLFEPAFIEGVKFGVEIIGASQFDESNPDWACDEIWEPNERRLNIPLSFSGETWEECLLNTQLLIQNVLTADSATARVLKSRDGIGVGFVDGDLSVLWP